LTKITISSITKSALPELLPALPWSTAAGTNIRSVPDRDDSPAICLRVDIDSIVDSRKEVGHWWTTRWPNLGEWFRPGYPDPSNSPTPRAFSQDWTEPLRNDATGKWEQTAVVCSWIHRSLLNKDSEVFHEPHINLRILRSRFSLEMKHRVAGRSINIVLSQVPWTSGIYRREPSSSGSNPLLPSPMPNFPLNQASGTRRLTEAQASHVGGALLSSEPPPPYIPN
jgi:hypothetical protein